MLNTLKKQKLNYENNNKRNIVLYNNILIFRTNNPF